MKHQHCCAHIKVIVHDTHQSAISRQTQSARSPVAVTWQPLTEHTSNFNLMVIPEHSGRQMRAGVCAELELNAPCHEPSSVKQLAGVHAMARTLLVRNNSRDARAVRQRACARTIRSLLSKALLRIIPASARADTISALQECTVTFSRCVC
jgi:hypothetical protein